MLPGASRINSDPRAPVVIAAFKEILLAALSVKELALAHAIGLTTVMLPRPVPLVLLVVIITFAAASAEVRLAIVTKESGMAPDPWKVRGFVPLAVLAVVSVPDMP